MCCFIWSVHFTEYLLIYFTHYGFNILWPGDAICWHRCRSTLVQVITCGLIVKWTLRNKLLWNFDLRTKFFMQENAFENVNHSVLDSMCSATTDRVEHEAVDSIACWQHHHCGATVEGVACSHDVTSWLQRVRLLGDPFCLLEGNTERRYNFGR